MKKKIVGIEAGSIAWELGIEAGSFLVSIDGQEIKDRLDYLFYTSALSYTLTLEEETLTDYLIEREPQEELGLLFEEGLMDEARHCQNRCVFCFIDQLPPGMRQSLYFKDDDSRLSFMQGNFVTLTNLKEEDLKRIIEHRIYPINVSVHSLDPVVRQRLLGHKKAGEIQDKLSYLAKHHALLNAQIVLVPGYNDAEELEKTIRGLFSLHPAMNSVAVVPLGLTRFRDQLTPLQSVGRKEALDALQRIHTLQKECKREAKTRFVFAADEFYLRAGQELPPHSAYEGYLHYENGVGMIRSFLVDFQKKRSQRGWKQTPFHLICGTDFYPWLKNVVEELNLAYNMDVTLQGINNDFFGHSITVSGLLTYEDIIRQCDKKEEAVLLLPENLFNHEGETLDNYRLEDFEEALGCPVRAVEPTATALIRALKE